MIFGGGLFMKQSQRTFRQQQFVDHAKCCPMWDLNQQHLAQTKTAWRPLKLLGKSCSLYAPLTGNPPQTVYVTRHFIHYVLCINGPLFWAETRTIGINVSSWFEKPCVTFDPIEIQRNENKNQIAPAVTRFGNAYDTIWAA